MQSPLIKTVPGYDFFNDMFKKPYASKEPGSETFHCSLCGQSQKMNIF